MWPWIIVVVLACLCLISLREANARTRKAFVVGRRLGVHEGWIEHAHGVPLSDPPPTTDELRRCGVTSDDLELMHYERSDDAAAGVSLDEWRRKRIEALNREHLRAATER